MPISLIRRLSLALPISFYVLALTALRLHWVKQDTPLLVVAVLAGLASLLAAAALVVHQRAAVGRLAS